MTTQELEEGTELCLEFGRFRVTRRRWRHAPNLNAYAERWVQAVQQECLDHFVFFGEEHFGHVVSEYVDYHNTQRPHQSKENRPLTQPLVPVKGDGRILCHERLGEVLKHYYRAAAGDEAGEVAMVGPLDVVDEWKAPHPEHGHRHAQQQREGGEEGEDATLHHPPLYRPPPCITVGPACAIGPNSAPSRSARPRIGEHRPASALARPQAPRGQLGLR